MNYTAQHLLDLSALAAATEDPDGLRAILHEGHEHYRQGLEETTATIQSRYAAHTDAQIKAALHRDGIPPVSDDRQSMIRTLAFHVWESTPAALAYSSIAERAARCGVCLLPE